jgi:nucleoside-diphosphate-sugar epimerase
MKSKKILVTGGEGYLGSILTPKLLESNYDVRIYDKLIFGKNVKENISLIEGDITDTEALSKAIRNGVDTIIHLAGVVGDPACLLNREKAFEVNVTATGKLAELCILYGVKKFIFTSSCSIYGAQPKKILTENSEPAPVDFYGQTKLAGEKAILEKFSKATVFRLGTLFGYSPRMRFDLVVNSFVIKSLTKKPLTVYGGAQHRPLLHLLDTSDAIILALEKNMKGIFNLCSGNFSILELAENIKKFISANIAITKEIQDKRDYIVSINKIKKFGYNPKRKIADGVKEIIEAFNSRKFSDSDNPIYYNHKWKC